MRISAGTSLKAEQNLMGAILALLGDVIVADGEKGRSLALCGAFSGANISELRDANSPVFLGVSLCRS